MNKSAAHDLELQILELEKSIEVNGPTLETLFKISEFHFRLNRPSKAAAYITSANDLYYNAPTSIKEGQCNYTLPPYLP